MPHVGSCWPSNKARFDSSANSTPTQVPPYLGALHLSSACLFLEGAARFNLSIMGIQPVSFPSVGCLVSFRVCSLGPTGRTTAFIRPATSPARDKKGFHPWVCV